MFPVLEGVGPDPLHVRCNDMCANVTAKEQDSEQAAICLDRHDHEAPNLGGIFFAQRPVDESKQLDSTYKPYMPTPSICRPNQKRTGPRCVAGGQLAPDSKRAKTLRNTLLNPLVEPVADALLFKPPFNQRVLKSITRIVHNVHPGPVPILGAELELIEGPEKFNAYVEQSYNGNMGLVLGQEDVMPQERMANIFQNTWAAQFLTYDDDKRTYTFACDETVISTERDGGKQPILDSLLNPEYDFRTFRKEALLAGGVRQGKWHFKMHDGKLTLSSATDNINGAARYEMTHCLHNAIQYYHTALHLASGTQSFAAKDIATDRPNGDAAWRLLNPGRNQSSKLYEVAEVLLTQAPVIYTRAMTSDDLRNMKTRTILPMLESPCNEYAKRYMPHGVPRADERHFAAALVDAQKIVCNETYRMHLPQADLDSYTRNLHTLQYPDNDRIASYHPAQTARLVGIEHTFTFSLNLMFGLDLKECTDKYWCWGKTLGNFAVAGLVTVIGNTTRSECMRDGTDENDDADTTSVTAELRKVAELPNVQRSGDPRTYEYKTQLIDMASALEHRWAEVQAQNEKRMMDKTLLSNFDFVLGKNGDRGFCQTSTTWV